MRRPATKIPFNRPFIVGRELEYIAEAVRAGRLAGDGTFSKRCHEWMERRFAARKVLLTPSCTSALELCALATRIGPGDEVIMPSYTFVSTANAFALRGATIRFVDIRPDTLNLDERKIEAAVTERTRAIVPVHYAGIGCEMDTINAIAEHCGAVVIEDAAQAVNATYKGRYLGTLGTLGAYSFHETKNFISGEGGAIVVNDEALIERVEILREKGTNRSAFLRGEVDKYTWHEAGSSYLPSEIVAAFLYAQLENADTITQRRTAIYRRYREGLEDLRARGVVQTPQIPRECAHNGHMFFLITRTAEMRDGLIDHLKARGIHALFHYVPLHTSPLGQRLGYARTSLPVTEDLSRRVLRLPCYYELDPQTQDRVIGEVRAYCERL